MNIGDIIKYYRNIYKLTQSQAAELSGINEKYLGRIERNESIPTIDKIEQICAVFDMRIQDLLATSIRDITSVEEHHPSVNKNNRIKFYCNCCGCLFELPSNFDDLNNIRCPECDCLYDTDNEHIEEFIS